MKLYLISRMMLTRISEYAAKYRDDLEPSITSLSLSLFLSSFAGEFRDKQKMEFLNGRS